MSDKPPQKKSLTKEFWDQIVRRGNDFEADWQTGIPSMPVAELFPIWNEAMKVVYAAGIAAGKTQGGTNPEEMARMIRDAELKGMEQMAKMIKLQLLQGKIITE